VVTTVLIGTIRPSMTSTTLTPVIATVRPWVVPTTGTASIAAETISEVGLFRFDMSLPTAPRGELIDRCGRR